MSCIALGVPEGPVRQGDIIEFGRHSERPYSCVAGVILTADCDLAQSKHYGHLLVCPILSSIEYFNEVWVPRRIGSMRVKLHEHIAEQVFQFARENGAASDVPLSTEVLELATATEASLRNVLQDLGVGDDARATRILRAREALALLTDESSPDFAGLVSAEALRLGGSSQEKIRSNLIAAFKDELNRDAVDVVVLPDQLLPSSLTQVVVLRSPFSVPVESVEGAAPAHRRIGQYDKQLKFLIAQKFGFLFSRIGMPHAVERERSESIDCLEIV